MNTFSSDSFVGWLAFGVGGLVTNPLLASYVTLSKLGDPQASVSVSISRVWYWHLHPGVIVK